MYPTVLDMTMPYCCTSPMLLCYTFPPPAWCCCTTARHHITCPTPGTPVEHAACMPRPLLPVNTLLTPSLATSSSLFWLLVYSCRTCWRLNPTYFVVMTVLPTRFPFIPLTCLPMVPIPAPTSSLSRVCLRRTSPWTWPVSLWWTPWPRPSRPIRSTTEIPLAAPTRTYLCELPLRPVFTIIFSDVDYNLEFWICSWPFVNMLKLWRSWSVISTSMKILLNSVQFMFFCC